MADFDNTALNSTVRELWDEKVQEARYAKGVLMNRVTNSSGVAQKKGDIIHVTIDQKYTVGTVSAAGAFTAQNYTPTTVDITLDQWEQIAIRVLDRAEAQSFWSPGSIFPRKVGEAFADRYDGQIASLHGSFTNKVGNTVTPSIFDKNSAQEALVLLASTNIPLEDLFFALHPTAYYTGLCDEEQLTAASKSGLDKNVLMTGKVFDLFGSPLVLSSNIVSTGTPATRKNFLLHKSAIAIAWQKNTEIERGRALAAGVFADIFAAQSLYGQSVIRTDHGVVISSQA